MSRIKQVLNFGQSFWQDYIERSELENGKLENLIKEDGIRGITSNPTIFHKAITGTANYDKEMSGLIAAGKNSPEIFHRLSVDDIKKAARIMERVYRESGGNDGFVSIEVNPHLAYDTQGTVREARALFEEIGQPNLMIKVPGTREGLPAISELIGAGINVNVTLLFSPAQYENAARAYIEGLEKAAAAARDLNKINSVASFFLSRIDTQADSGLDKLLQEGKIDKELHKKLRGQAAVAVAKVTYDRFEKIFYGEPAFQALRAKGAKLQRPLWASTGTKDKSYSDVKYVEPLIGPHTVNTLPPATLDAFREHGVAAETLKAGIKNAPGLLEEIVAAGVELEKIYTQLQNKGVAAFEKSFDDLLAAIEEKARAMRGCN